MEQAVLTKSNVSDNLFDETSGYDDETGVRFAGGLSPEEKQQATVLYRLFNELWGVCIVVGDPGTGKDLFGNWLAYRIKTLFPWKRILRDEKPRKLFGEYAGLFNESVLKTDLAKMRAMASGYKITEVADVMDKAADNWVTESGQVLLKNSLLYLTEYWRYCYNREPHNPMNRTMGAIHKVKRHLDCLILGTVQLPSELDKKTCLPWVDWQVTCTRSRSNKTRFVFFVRKVKYDRRMESLEILSKPFPIAFDAAKPRSNMGDGKIIIRRPDYIPETEEERIVLDVIRAGADTYESLVNYIVDNGDMTEDEILATLKELRLRRSKRVIDYPCYFALYNSKSAPQIRTSLRMQEE